MAPPPMKRSVTTFLKKPPDKIILSKSVASGSTITHSDSADIRTKPQDVNSKQPKAKEDPQAGKTVSKVIESIFDDPEMMISSADSDASSIISDSDWQ